jgi:hypothetical protein
MCIEKSAAGNSVTFSAQELLPTVSRVPSQNKMLSLNSRLSFPTTREAAVATVYNRT